MDWGTVGVLLGFMFAWGALFWWRIERNSLILTQQLVEASNDVSATFPIDEIKEELSELIFETIGEMRPPAIADHLGGILSQWAQIKMAKSMQDMGMSQLITPQEPMLEDELN